MEVVLEISLSLVCSRIVNRKSESLRFFLFVSIELEVDKVQSIRVCQFNMLNV